MSAPSFKITEPKPNPQKQTIEKPPAYRNITNNNYGRPTNPPMAKPIFHPSFQPVTKPRRKCCSCRCCCCFFCAFTFILIILVALFGAFFYLWFDPKPPSFHLDSIKFPRFNVSVKPDGSYLNIQSLVKFEAINNNEKISFDYGETRVSMTIGDEIELGEAIIPGFKQVKKNTTMLKFRMNASDLLVDNADGKKLMDEFRHEKLPVSIDVRTKFGITLDEWNLKLKKLSVRVLCVDVTMKGLEAGRDRAKCSIEVMRLIKVH